MRYVCISGIFRIDCASHYLLKNLLPVLWDLRAVAVVAGYSLVTLPLTAFGSVVRGGRVG